MPPSEDPARRSAPHGPKRRRDSTRPAGTPSGTRRGGDRRPWPTASTTTKVSPAKPGPTSVRAGSHGSAAVSSQPTPATVWTAGPAPIDLDATWPTPIVRTIVGSFSTPGGRVVLLAPQATPSARRRLGVVDAHGVIEHAPGTDQDGDHDAEVADALAAVASLDRTARVARIASDATVTGPASRPFWADLVSDDRAPVTASPPSPSGIDGTVLDGPEAVPQEADLIITSLRPTDGGDRFSDLVALVAARLLRVGGILAVLTHCDWTSGELTDPTGVVVASAQNADLLYLQHIVALHAPVSSGRFATELLTDADSSAAEARAEHRAAVRGLPAPHRRIHTDVLVFAQPHEYEPLPVSPAEQAAETGVIR
jgi:hypothetical protein